MNLYGMRKVKVFTNVTEAEVDRHGAFGYLEVENPGNTDIQFKFNDFIEQGHVGITLPIKANSTRKIPVKIYHFVASGPVNVVAYGL